LNEATIKAAVKENEDTTSLESEVIDGSETPNEPIENYDISNETDILVLMHNKAL
jgi:hypothetical protein